MPPDGSMPSTAIGTARWGRLVPIAFITYSLAYVDRANYSIGSAAGLTKDLGITGQAGALLGALFFLGYFLFQIPAAWYAEERSAKRLMFWSLLLWGVLATLTGLIYNVSLLYVDRFFLGVAESVVLPGMLIFLSHWFTSAERSRTNAFLIIGNPVTVLWMSIVSGYLADSLGWRGMFIIEGLPAIIWAFLWLRLVQDEPAHAPWLNPSELETSQSATQRRAARAEACGQLRRGVQILCRHRLVDPVFLLERWRLRIRPLAAIDPQGGPVNLASLNWAGCPPSPTLSRQCS